VRENLWEKENENNESQSTQGRNQLSVGCLAASEAGWGNCFRERGGGEGGRILSQIFYPSMLNNSSSSSRVTTGPLNGLNGCC